METECSNSHNKCSSNTPYIMLQLSEIDSLMSQIRTGDTHVLTFLIISCLFPIIFPFLFSYQLFYPTFSAAFLSVFFLFFDRNYSLSLFSILTFSTFFLATLLNILTYATHSNISIFLLHIPWNRPKIFFENPTHVPKRTKRN